MNEASEVFDRRVATRVRTQIPVDIQFTDSTRNLICIHGTATDISEHGLCIITKDQLPTETDVALSFIFPNAPETFTAVGRFVVKTTSDQLEFHKYGVRMQQVHPESKRRLSLWLAKVLLETESLKDRRFQRSIQSRFVSYKNRTGHSIVGFIDSPAESDETLPFLVVISGFGETKTNVLSLSYTLVKNGFRVLRYDATNHTGESEGTILECTLSQLKEDLLDGVEYISREYPCVRVGLIMSSLSALSGIHAAAEDERIVFVGGLVPVVNLQYTLQAVYNEDLVGTHVQGKRRGFIDMLGFPINADQFLSDAVLHQFHDLQAIKNQISKIKAPITFLIGSHDLWVAESDVSTVLGSTNGYIHEYSVIQSSMHQFHENPLASKEALTRITQAAANAMLGRDSGEIVFPRLREIAIQARLERERRRLSSYVEKDSEVQFWGQYLQKFRSIIRVPDFRDFYSAIQTLMGDFANGDLVLDAGCGNGTYGVWLLHSLIEAKQKAGKKSVLPAFTYVGLDFVSSALEQARHGHASILTKLAEESRRTSVSNPQFLYVLADLDQKLPFINGYFNKICCNLVVSYIRHAQDTFRELYRILAPGGNLVITSLKPYADLSAVYRNFLQMADTPEDITEARKLLANAGLIRSRETEGHFKFFNEAELIGMALELGAKNPTIMRSFANQANIVVIRKDRSPSQ